MSTTRSTACTVASNYACSTPSMTITASSRSPGQARGPCLMARDVLSLRCCGRAAMRSAPFCAASGIDTRFIVTNLEGGRAKPLYERLYCARGQAENHIKAWKNHLAADRTSCHEATANQFRLFLHAGAYWLLWSMRRLMPKSSAWRVMQFDTLRLRLIKIAARVVELKKQIKIHLPSSTPDQAIFGIILSRLPRLIT